jgi:hypothetical protein
MLAEYLILFMGLFLIAVQYFKNDAVFDSSVVFSDTINGHVLFEYM